MTEFSTSTPRSRRVSSDLGRETPLHRLDLCRRTYNALLRGGVQTVEELVQLPRGHLEQLRNIGAASLKEIDSQLAAFRAKETLPSQVNGAIPQNTPQESLLAIRASTVRDLARGRMQQHTNDEWREAFRSLATDGTPISSLNLSEGLQRLLAEADLHTIADLAQVTTDQLLSLPRMGGMSVSKLRTALIAYLLEADNPFDAPKVNDEEKAANTRQSHRQGILSRLVSSDTAAQLADAPLDLVPIKRLTLNPTQTKDLYLAHVFAVGQLVDFSSYLSNNDPLLVALKDYLATTGPDQLAKDAVSAEELVQYQARTISDVGFWLSTLEERDRSIVEGRYGLYGPNLTLEEIGQQIGLSRERVRQLEKRALRLLREKHATAIENMADSLTDYVLKRGGVVTLSEAVDWFDAKQDSLIQTSPEGAILLLATLAESPLYLRKPNVFLHSELPANLFVTVQKAMADLLDARMAPTAAHVLLRDFRKTSMYQSAQSIWSESISVDIEAFALACLRTGDNVEREPGVYARRQWDNRIGDNIVVALREIGEPAHFTSITEAVNKQLPDDKKTNAHNVQGHMLRYESIFTRVGHGTYALVEWGAKQDDSIAETAARVLREAEQPLHIETITDEVLTSWQVNRSTVYMALHHDGYYRDETGRGDLCFLLGDGVFTLSKWEAARATETRPVLPYCPPILPDPPDFENALFESVMVARNRLAAAPRAKEFLGKMFAWAGYDSEPKRWLQQGVLNSYYLLGLIPYTYIYGGDDPRLRSTLPPGTLGDVRLSCLKALTQRLAHMPAFWGLLRHRTPVRQKELAETFVTARGDKLDDTAARLALLSGMGAITRGGDYYYRLTPPGEQAANAWGIRPHNVTTKLVPGEGLSHGGWDDLLDLGLLE